MDTNNNKEILEEKINQDVLNKVETNLIRDTFDLKAPLDDIMRNL